jgi:hypothetical protein
MLAMACGSIDEEAGPGRSEVLDLKPSSSSLLLERLGIENGERHCKDYEEDA